MQEKFGVKHHFIHCIKLPAKNLSRRANFAGKVAAWASICIRALGGVAVNKSFFEQVYEVVGRIPYAKVISYGQIARILGEPRAARKVGWAMSRCPKHLPWHRVVMADGSVTGGIFYELRRERLKNEGVRFLPNGRVDMKSCEWLTT